MCKCAQMIADVVQGRLLSMLGSSKFLWFFAFVGVIYVTCECGFVMKVMRTSC